VHRGANRRDVDAVLAHFADDAEFCSPLVVSHWRAQRRRPRA
jgi:hypothetical protein